MLRGGCRRARRLDRANRRSTAGGRADKFSAGEGSRACKPRVKPMQSAERRRCNQRELPAKPGARWRTGKEGSPAGRKPERLSPSGWKHCVQWKFCIPSRVLRQFCMPNSTLPRKQYSIPQRNLLRRCKIIVEKGCFKRKKGAVACATAPFGNLLRF